MRRLTFLLVPLFALTIVGPAAAQSGQGTYIFVTLSADTIVKPDGALQIVIHQRQVMLASDATFPTHNLKSECVALVRVVDGKVVGGSGSCFGESMDGHGLAQWWEMTESGTSACPVSCGTFAYFGGYGRFAGATGGGTWKYNGDFPDGSAGSGTWAGTVTVKR